MTVKGECKKKPWNIINGLLGKNNTSKDVSSYIRINNVLVNVLLINFVHTLQLLVLILQIKYHHLNFNQSIIAGRIHLV